MTLLGGAGYSGKSLAEKLGIKLGMEIVILSAPGHYLDLLEPLPLGVHIQKLLLRSDRKFIHCFVRDRDELERQFESLKEALAPDGTLWISWPKGTSKLKTDLSDSAVREIGLRHGLVDVKVAAIDADWSALKFVYRVKDR